MNVLKVDALIAPSGDLRRDFARIKRAEQLGYDAVWAPEGRHNPFFPLTLAANDTRAILLGTSDAQAFPRSPMVTAQIAWDLARQSAGRFALGLSMDGGADASDPVGRMREYVESLRAIWDTFQTGARLRYRGEHYQFRLMAPFFNPGPIAQPQLPIALTGGQPGSCQLAGEIGEFLHVNGLHTPAYLREVALPAVDAGLRKAGRTRGDIMIVAQVFVISGESEAERHRAESALRERLGILASRRENRRIMHWHGLETLADRLEAMARAGRWTAMATAMPDDLLRQRAIAAAPAELFTMIHARYGGIADRVCIEWLTDCPALSAATASSRPPSE